MLNTPPILSLSACSFIERFEISAHLRKSRHADPIELAIRAIYLFCSCQQIMKVSEVWECGVRWRGSAFSTLYFEHKILLCFEIMLFAVPPEEMSMAP